MEKDNHLFDGMRYAMHAAMSNKISLQKMIACVEAYILVRKGVRVNIHIHLYMVMKSYSDDQPHLNKLGRAYDIAIAWLSNAGYNVEHYE